MGTTIWYGNPVWPLWQKIIFRFFFIYFSLLVIPLWVELFQNIDFISFYYLQFEGWVMNAANQYLFHSFTKLSGPDGLPDNSYGWTQIRFYFMMAVSGSFIWSLLDIKRSNYNRLSYWFRILLRYYIAMECLGYGIEKLFHHQMPYPSLAQLSTPLGDNYPQALEWMSMGYATKYQIFTGGIEVLTGLLLLFRRTATFGTLLATATFTIVFMTDIGYDVWAKLFSLHLLVMSFVLMAYEYKRLADFLVFNSTAISGKLYDVRFSKSWMRITRKALKLFFIWQIVIWPFLHRVKVDNASRKNIEIKPIPPGIYNVTAYTKNGDTIPALTTNSLRWQKVLFNDKSDNGYIIPYDTLFFKRFDVGYFHYSVDPIKHEIQFMKSKTSSSELYSTFLMKYELPDSNTIVLSGIIRQDSVVAILKNTHRHFALVDWKMHWLWDDDWYDKEFVK